MPYGKCGDCGRVTSYRNTRGTRLAEIRCDCGGTLKGCTYEGEPLQRNTAKFAVCAVCLRKRRKYLVVTEPGTYIGYRDSTRVEVAVPVGATICDHHEQVKPQMELFGVVAPERVIPTYAELHNGRPL